MAINDRGWPPASTAGRAGTRRAAQADEPEEHEPEADRQTD